MSTSSTTATSELQIPAAKSGKGGKGKHTQVACSHWGPSGWKGFDWSTLNVTSLILYTAVRNLTFAKEVLIAQEEASSRTFVITTTHQNMYIPVEFDNDKDALDYFTAQVTKLL